MERIVENKDIQPYTDNFYKSYEGSKWKIATHQCLLSHFTDLTVLKEDSKLGGCKINSPLNIKLNEVKKHYCLHLHKYFKDVPALVTDRCDDCYEAENMDKESLFYHMIDMHDNQFLIDKLVQIHYDNGVNMAEVIEALARYDERFCKSYKKFFGTLTYYIHLLVMSNPQSLVVSMLSFILDENS